MGLFSGILGLAGSIFGGNSASKGARDAARIQAAAAEKGIAESRRQYDLTRSDYQPFRDLGYGALDNFGNLIGINGADKQQAEIDLLKASPLYQSLFDNGQEAMLASASATGGLRGGNFQEASMDFGRDTLDTVIRDQLANYSGAIGIGSGATDAVSSFGARAVESNNAARERAAAGSAQARLVGAGAQNQMWNNLGSTFGNILDGGGGFDWGKLF